MQTTVTFFSLLPVNIKNSQVALQAQHKEMNILLITLQGTEIWCFVQSMPRNITSLLPFPTTWITVGAMTCIWRKLEAVFFLFREADIIICLFSSLWVHSLEFSCSGLCILKFISFLIKSYLYPVFLIRNHLFWSIMIHMQVFTFSKHIAAPYDLVMQTKQMGRLPVVQFAAGGIATPADAALMMQLGCDGVFVGSGIFKSSDSARRARAIVQAVTHYNDPEVLAEVSCGLGEAMAGINLNCNPRARRFAERSD
jgi:Thiazole biosynthesis protein ThiG